MKENKVSATGPSSSTARKLFVPASFRTELLSELKGAPVSVYLAYCSYANKDGLAWPSLRTLEAVTGYGINAVKDARRYLVTMGLLVAAEQSRAGGRFGRKDFQICTVAQKQCHGTVASPTVAPSTVARCTVARKQCQEGSPSEGVAFEGSPKGEGILINAVRRRVDAEQRPRVNSSPLQSQKLETPPYRTKSQKLKTRLESKIKTTGDSYADWIERCRQKGREHPFGKEEQDAFKALQYKPDLKSPLLSWEFVTAVTEVYEKHADRGVLPGNLCSKVIDFCTTERKRDGGEGYYWPPDFQAHRDRLREEERQRTQSEQVAAGARA